MSYEPRILFASMSDDGRKFYNKVFNHVLLNIHAVRHGYFPVLFCETEDPKVIRFWKDSLPKIIEIMHAKNTKNL